MNLIAQLRKFRIWRQKRRIARIERAFQIACFDFLTMRRWIPNEKEPGRWINYEKHANGVTTLNLSFRDALYRTTGEAKPAKP